MYRFHTLPAAKARARSRRYKGALYAWESAETGEDVTPPRVIAPTGEVFAVASGESEHHISADVAYAVWSYFWATLDEQFLLAAGAEILFETARFWASRVTPGEDGLFHILNVIGPDEYHEAVDDNAYTNTMAQWNLERAADVAQILRDRWPGRARELAAKIALDDTEIEAWHAVAAKIYVGVDPETRVIEQFRGYFALEDISLAGFEPRTAPMDIILGRERTQRSKIVKQADVVLLIYLLWDRFPPEVREASFRYYEPRCAHGSSLSPCIHALVAARLEQLELAVRYFRQSADIDLADNMGNAAGGVHAAALGGLWQAAVFGFGGVELHAEGPVAAPHLPPAWRFLLLDLKWRGQWLSVDARHEGAAVRPLLRMMGAAS
jgi:kojibiose phosphorylase